MLIYFKDLKEEVQNELLAEFGIDNEKEMNWDVFPVAEIYCDGVLNETTAKEYLDDFECGYGDYNDRVEGFAEYFGVSEEEAEGWITEWASGML